MEVLSRPGAIRRARADYTASRGGVSGRARRAANSAETERGVGKLDDADLSEESAKLQSLQVRQQLGVQALLIANQAPQIILQVFGG